MSSTESAHSSAQTPALAVEREFLSPKAAGKRVGVDRTTILRALKNEELKAHRDNERGFWKIDPEAVDLWAKQRGHTRDAQGAEHSAPKGERPAPSSDLVNRLIAAENARSDAEKNAGIAEQRAEQAEQRVDELKEELAAERSRTTAAEAERREAQARVDDAQSEKARAEQDNARLTERVTNLQQQLANAQRPWWRRRKG